MERPVDVRAVRESWQARSMRPTQSVDMLRNHRTSQQNLSQLDARPHRTHNVADDTRRPIGARSSADLRAKPSLNYVENGTRWMEKQEVKSLRQALNDMDLAQEKRLRRAAQDDAAELVWKHQNPDASFQNPDMRKDYRAHLRQGSYSQAYANGAMHALGSRSSSGSSQQSDGEPEGRVTLAKRKSMDMLRKITPPSLRSSSQRSGSSSSKRYGELADLVRKDINATRRISSGSRRTMSGSKKGFMHPHDKIWEDEQAMMGTQRSAIPELKPTTISAVPSYTRKNPFTRVRLQHDKVERSNSAPLLGQPAKVDRPAASPASAINSLSDDLLPTLSAIGREATRGHEAPGRDSLEIRSDEIRAATSKRRSDRSPNLPQPAIVSDRHDRPIVSFDRARQLDGIGVETSRQPQRPDPDRPGSSASTIVRTAIPVLNLPDDDGSRPEQHSAVPILCLPDNAQRIAVPTISIEQPSSRPLPVAQAKHIRQKSTPHYSPSVRHSGILCAHCALPIAGRVLSAAGQRFHPGCFVCQQCNTNLELVAFYPEPENKRHERVERIRARQSGRYAAQGESEAAALQQEAEDGDESLRFYCHLDFHELFSPRCKSCKTPIEGEVIIACGAEWHAGHFFCAQCGDPFDSTTPFVEKDGYAWCVGCHTNRYSSKCRKCKKPVTDVVVKALGSDWHSQCFCCMECNRSFDDGRYFLHGDDPVCIRCEERRLKA